MNWWLAAAAALVTGGLGPSLWGAASGTPGRRVVSQNMATLLLCLVFLLLSQGYGRPSYADLALVVSVLGPAGTLVFVRLLGEELEKHPPGARLLTPAVAIGAPATVVPLCVATGPGRAMVKLLVIGALLLAGAAVTTRAVRRA
ncbi:monovalent cation/H+ antiporter complex subunit F [Streptomyces sp. NPDC026206]|uniref:monovalent cation/H+ antiporter complex subunit F n=1 Tax=Streptomyces sp. NPDC026206 TaxID=3157089 RepID=UPI0033F47C08